MRVLLVDDEVGIRDGLAAFLRLRAVEVHTAADAAGACAALSTVAPDVVVTDWKLAGGDAAPLVAAAAVPVLVVTGCPERVRLPAASAGRDDVRVVRKPLLPHDLADALARLAAAEEAPGEPDRGAAVSPRPAEPAGVAALPTDTRHRVRLLLSALPAAAAARARLQDDGDCTVLHAPCAPDAGLVEIAERLGGDLRQVTTAPGAAPALTWRLRRDGAPEVDVRIGPEDPWPPGGDAVAVDLHRCTLAPAAFCRLLDRVAGARRQGRQVHLLNVPGHLRAWAEILGRGADLPMRTASGPRLTAERRALWS